MMIDWITVELPDPVGVRINDGAVVRYKADGSVEWATDCRKVVEGSWSSSMTVRALGAEHVEGQYDELSGRFVASSLSLAKSGLVLSGNPNKFLNGHNLYGSDELLDLLFLTCRQLQPHIWPQGGEIGVEDLAEGTISRIDLTNSWLVERPSDVEPFLRALEHGAFVARRGRGVMDDPGTLYYGKVRKGQRSKAWLLKLYDKGTEITVHKLPEPAYLVPGLLDEVNRTVRVELTLRTAELKRLGLTKVSDWTPETVRKVWQMYVDKLELGDAREIDRSAADLAALPGIKPRHVAAIAAWKAGEDIASIYVKKSTRYRIRQEVLDLTGIDLFTKMQRSNVVMLRRVIEAVPAGRPAWADDLERALLAA